MTSSPEFRDARLVIAGAPGSGRSDFIEAVAARAGGPPPEELEGGRWTTLRAEVSAQGRHLELRCLVGPCGYRGVEELLLGGADGVILLFDVSPGSIGASRRYFDAWWPRLQETGRPAAVQYHRIEREPRFETARMDDWLGLAGTDVPRAATTSGAPAEAFDVLLPGLLGSTSDP